MRYFRIVSNSCFYTIPGQEKGMFGFYATFHVAAESALEAVEDVSGLVIGQVIGHGLKNNRYSLFSPFCYVSDIWEITEKEHRERLHKEFGVVFYKIGALNGMRLLAKKIYLSIVNRNYLIECRLTD